MAGVSGLHIEDQVVPKKCGFFTGHALVSIDEMCQRVRAALEARRNPDTVIIARTEALAAKDMDESIERAKAYMAAGADMIFVNGVTREEDARRIAAEVPGSKLYNVSTSGRTPHLHEDVIKEMGYRLVIYPAHTLFFALHEIRGLLTSLKEAGTIAPSLGRMIDFDEWQRVTGVPEIEALEKRYSSE
jgi:2-methylisocitrate lyase-like PEP mutase family enzyme